jgi:hypothetical protein
MKTISFKVSEDEARLIALRAREEGLTVSEYLRRRATGTRAPGGAPRRVRCAHTGVLIFGPCSDLPPLSTESVRAMLAEFP